jgi:hypothetical protein
MDIGELHFDGMNWIEVTRNQKQCWVLFLIVMKLWLQTTDIITDFVPFFGMINNIILLVSSVFLG